MWGPDQVMSEVEETSGLSSLMILHKEAEAQGEQVELRRLEFSCVTMGSKSPSLNWRFLTESGGLALRCLWFLLTQ